MNWIQNMNRCVGPASWDASKPKETTMWSPRENDDFFGEPQEEDKDPPAAAVGHEQRAKEDIQIRLRRCPFCGSDAALWKGGSDQWRVHCHGCEVLKGPHDSAHMAAYFWNKRTPELLPADPLHIEELFEEAAGADEETHVRFARLLEQQHGIGT